MFFNPIFTVSLTKLKILDQTTEHQSVERFNVIVLVKEISSQFLSMKWNFRFFSEQNRQTPFPTACLKLPKFDARSPQTLLQDPGAHCLPALAMEFLAKIIGNPDVLRVQVLLCCTCLAYFAM